MYESFMRLKHGVALASETSLNDMQAKLAQPKNARGRPLACVPIHYHQFAFAHTSTTPAISSPQSPASSMLAPVNVTFKVVGT